jgi:LmbE family N-acetylglucosaminyl deacetylase
VPFRLLGLVVDPSRAGELCGHTFAHYVAAGADVTLAVVAAHDLTAAEARTTLDRVGVRNAVLLGLAPDDAHAESLEPLLADLMAALSPHVVVMDGAHAGLARAAGSAFAAARRRLAGTPGRPAKLYVRVASPDPRHEVTTAVSRRASGPPELFSRVYPSAWITGVLERDLFGGLTAEPGRPLEERLAS